MKTPRSTRLISGKEKEVDAQMQSTHDKHVYSFTTDEHARMVQIESTMEILKMVEELKSNTVVAGAMNRVRQPLVKEHAVIYDLPSNIFIVYTPKVSKDAAAIQPRDPQ